MIQSTPKEKREVTLVTLREISELTGLHYQVLWRSITHTSCAVPNERIAKAFIDEMTEEQRKQFHSYKECGRILKMDRIEEITPPSVWDEKAGVFLHWHDLLDGAHRTSPLRVD